jgi:DivIVA domain-containing protein
MQQGPMQQGPMQQGPTGEEIRAATFPQERRRGYRVEDVRRFLAQVADRVDELQGRIDAQAHSDHAAMLLLQQARETADRTIAEAEATAAALRAEAESEVESVVAASRAEAAQRAAGADAHAETVLATAADRLEELERLVDARRQEVAMLEAASARFASDQAARLREQAGVLLGAAESITEASGPTDAVDLRDEHPEADAGGSVEPDVSVAPATP